MKKSTVSHYHYMMRFISISLFLSFFSFNVFSQEKNTSVNGTAASMEKDIMLVSFPYKGETLPLITLKEVTIHGTRTFKNEKDSRDYLKLKRDVRKAYPYAVLASLKLREYDAVLTNIPESKRAPYLKKAEKNLNDQFSEDLRKLTMKQGRILIRLIDRETGKSTYKVIKEYRGSFSAFMWQSFGLLFGNNLKWKYDPTKGEDQLIEEIIQQIQDGEV